MVIRPVAVHRPVAGSNNSAVRWSEVNPPATSTVPFASRVIDDDARQATIGPVSVHLPVVGS